MVRYALAKAEDQSKVEQFLSQFVNDYLVSQISDYIAQRTGGLYLAYQSDELIGTAVVSLPKAHEACLGGMRVTPSFQGTGLEREIAQFQIEEARRLGAQIIRAVRGADNQAEQELWEGQLGFQPVVEWVVGRIEGASKAEGPTFAPATAGPAWAVDRDRLLTFWGRHQDDVWAGQNLWAPHGFSGEDVLTQLERGSVGMAPQADGIEVDSMAIFRVANKALRLHYLRSAGAYLKDLIAYLGVEARAWGVTAIRFGLTRDAADQLLAVATGEITEEWRGVVLEAVANPTARS
ncbi:MAG: GNAT family N-acetyltransferase [Thermaerobacter sp.]|nr:GNAT family N-acetyltransferase [Thermaerobacter sp.]